MDGQTPEQGPNFERPARSSRTSPLANIHLHQPSPETRLAPLVVDVETEPIEVLPQLPAVETIPGYLRGAAASSSRAGPSSGRNSSSSRATSSEVICIDDSPARPSVARPESSSRKLRRLNNSAPVIVVDDDEDVIETAPRRANRVQCDAVPPSMPQMVPDALPQMRRAARPDSSNSLRPVRSRVRSTDRVRRYRAPGPVNSTGAFSDESSRTRDMPSLNARSGQIRLPAYAAPSSSSSARHMRTAEESDAPAPATTATPNGASRIATLLSTFGYARVNNRRGGGGSSSRRSLNIGRSLHTVEVTSSSPRGRVRFSEQALLHSIVHHFAQHGETVGFELRYVSHPSLDYESLVRLDEQLMRQRNAAPKDIINELPEVVATASDLDVRCVVCMCDIELGEKLRVLPCEHKYHKKCIDEWLTYNGCCPVDKQRICDFQSARPNENS